MRWSNTTRASEMAKGKASKASRVSKAKVRDKARVRVQEELLEAANPKTKDKHH